MADDDVNSIPTYEEICEWGRTAAANIDQGRWLIGDLALEVDKRYGKNTVADFAKQINVPVNRVKEYRTTCKFWQNSVRTDILDNNPVITYTHMRKAMRFKDVSIARRFIDECAGNAWTVERAGIEIKARLGEPVPPMNVLNVIARIEHVSIHTGDFPRAVIVFDEGVDVFALQRCQGMVVQVVVKAEETKEAQHPAPLVGVA